MTNEQVYNTIASGYVGGHVKLQHRSNIYNLADIARKVSGNILDVGSGGGASLGALALASSPSAKVFSVDPNMPQGLLDRIMKWDLSGKVFLVPGKSEEVLDSWDLPLDIIFIDGVHKYGAVKADAEGYEKYLNIGGYLAFHDYNNYRNSVGKAIDVFMEEHPNYHKVLLEEELYIAQKYET